MIARLLPTTCILSFLSPILSFPLSTASLQDSDNITTATRYPTDLAPPSNLTFVKWPKVPPSFSKKIPGVDDFTLLFTRIDVYTHEPLPEPRDLQSYLREFIANLDESTQGQEFSPARAGQSFVDMHSFTTYMIKLDMVWSFAVRELRWEVLRKALLVLVGVMTNRDPAVLNVGVVDREGKGYYNIKTDINAFYDAAGTVEDLEGAIGRNLEVVR